MGPLSRKRALVCGSTRGIGRACAFELARLGAQVTLLARDEEALRNVRDQLPTTEPGTEAPPRHDCLVADFSDPPAVKSVVAGHLEKTGPIQNLLNNTVRAAVANWAKTLASELAPFGITVNNVLPGSTMTGRLSSLIQARARAGGVPVEEIEREMKREIPAGRFGTPEEIAAGVGFLATPAASYITGINLP